MYGLSTYTKDKCLHINLSRRKGSVVEWKGSRWNDPHASSLDVVNAPRKRASNPNKHELQKLGSLRAVSTKAADIFIKNCSPGTTVSVMEAMKRIRDHYSQQGRMRCVAAASIANHGALRAVADARPSACPSSSYASSRSGRLPTTRGTVTSSRNLRRQPPPLPSRHLRDPCLVQSSKTPPPTRPSPPKQAGSRGTKKLEQKDVLGERWAEDSSFSGNTTTSTKDRLQAKEQRKLKKAGTDRHIIAVDPKHMGALGG